MQDKIIIEILSEIYMKMYLQYQIYGNLLKNYRKHLLSMRFELLGPDYVSMVCCPSNFFLVVAIS